VYDVHLVKEMMTAPTDSTVQPRAPLSRQRILDAAVALADEGGADALSMRRLAQELGVVPMALYKHVANKDELLDGMLDVVIGEIDPPLAGDDWTRAMRERILSARRALMRHRWASRVIESRHEPTPAVMAYMNEMIGIFRTGGLSIDLTHHAMHAMGSRLLGFSQELFDDSLSIPDPEVVSVMLQELSPFPYIVELLTAITHDAASVVGPGCDDQVEFEFALDLMLEGLARLHEREQGRGKSG
jgi:AcrR family transcriptional regulator